MANYSSSAGFLDQFKDQLNNEGSAEQQKTETQQTTGEGQTEWTQEQIQQYYQQYGYDYYNYYQQDGQQSGGTASSTTSSQTPSYDQFSAYQAYASDPYAQYYTALAHSAYAAANYDYSGYDRRQQQQGPGQEPSRSVWLGNIHPDTTESELHASFAPFGMIEHVKILPAKNCAFVRFIELDAAIRAHSGMFNGSIHGQQIKIGWGKAEPQQKEETGPPPCRNLWLGNISSDISEEQIRMAFGTFGTIDKVRILPQKNCAFVNFASLEAAIQAKNQMQGATLGDRPVKINFGKETPTPTPGTTGGGGGGGGGGGIGDLSKPIEPEKPQAPPPPPEGPPPEDPGDKSIIDKLAEFVARNGLKFEHMMQEKQKDNPKFNFIEEGHPHNLYYRFKVWCYRYPNVDPKSYVPPPPPSEEDTTSPPLPTSTGLYSAVPPPSHLAPIIKPTGPPPGQDPDLWELSQLLDSLVPTKDSIKTAKTWIMSKPEKANDIALFIQNRIEKLTDFEKKLNIVYLIHDVLHHSSRERAKTESTDIFSESFKPHLGLILDFGTRGESADNQEKILKVIRIWEDKKIFDPPVIKDFEKGIQLAERQEDPSSSYRGRSSSSERSRHHHRSRDDDRDRKRRDRDRDREDRGRDRDRDRDDRYESKHRRH